MYGQPLLWVLTSRLETASITSIMQHSECPKRSNVQRRRRSIFRRVCIGRQPRQPWPLPAGSRVHIRVGAGNRPPRPGSGSPRCQEEHVGWLRDEWETERGLNLGLEEAARRLKRQRPSRVIAPKGPWRRPPSERARRPRESTACRSVFRCGALSRSID